MILEPTADLVLELMSDDTTWPFWIFFAQELGAREMNLGFVVDVSGVASRTPERSVEATKWLGWRVGWRIEDAKACGCLRNLESSGRPCKRSLGAIWSPGCLTLT